MRGASAVLLDGFIRANRELWNRHTGQAMTSPTLRRELTSAMLALEAAADRHRAEIDASAGGSGGTLTEMPKFLTPVEASEILGLTPRRVRQLAADGALLGRMRAGRWQIDAHSVQARRSA